MKFLLNKFLYYRDAFAIAIFITGFPIIYYIRDGLKIAPNSAAFTVLFALGPLLLTLLFKSYRFFETPNKVGFLLVFSFLFLCLGYFVLRDPYSNLKATYEIFTFSLIFFISFSLIFISRESLNHNFISIALILSAIGCILLLIYVYRDPIFILGQRATIRFGDDEKSGGNPHIYSKTAFFGLILGFLALKHSEKVKFGIILPVIFIVLFLVVLFLTQTMAVILATLIFLFLYSLFNLKLKKAYSSILSLLLKWYVLLILIAGIAKGVMYVNKNGDILKPTVDYATKRVGKIITSIFSSSDGKKKVSKNADESASMRVHLVNVAIENLDENFTEGKLRYILFGNGYKHLYMDIPHFEVFDSFGLFMLLFYTYLFYYMSKICIGEMRNPKSLATEFIAYGFILYFVVNFSGGLLIDYGRFGYYILVCRFIKN